MHTSVKRGKRIVRPPSKSDRDRLLQVAALVHYRLELLTGDEPEGFARLFNRPDRSELALLRTIEAIAEV